MDHFKDCGDNRIFVGEWTQIQSRNTAGFVTRMTSSNELKVSYGTYKVVTVETPASTHRMILNVFGRMVKIN